MAERRALVDGIRPTTTAVEPDKEKQFIYDEKETPTPSGVALINRAPISIRLRTDLATALKRASLERQLKGVKPSTLQGILDEAVEPWLRSNGYLP